MKNRRDAVRRIELAAVRLNQADKMPGDIGRYWFLARDDGWRLSFNSRIIKLGQICEKRAYRRASYSYFLANFGQFRADQHSSPECRVLSRCLRINLPWARRSLQPG